MQIKLLPSLLPVFVKTPGPVTTCKKCGAPVSWSTTRKGKKVCIHVNASVLDERGKYMLHMDLCGREEGAEDALGRASSLPASIETLEGWDD